MALWVDCACVLLAVDYLKQFVVLFFISTKQFGKFTVVIALMQKTFANNATATFVYGTV